MSRVRYMQTLESLSGTVLVARIGAPWEVRLRGTATPVTFYSAETAGSSIPGTSANLVTRNGRVEPVATVGGELWLDSGVSYDEYTTADGAAVSGGNPLVKVGADDAVSGDAERRFSADDPPSKIVPTSGTGRIPGKVMDRDKVWAGDFGKCGNGDDDTDVLAEGIYETAEEGKALNVADGVYGIGALLNDPTQGKPFRIHGAGKDSVTWEHGAGGTHILGGALAGFDAERSVTVPASIGDTTVTLDTTDDLQEGDWLLLADPSQHVMGASTYTQVRIEGQWALVFSVDSSTVVTLGGRLEIPLTTAAKAKTMKSAPVGIAWSGMTVRSAQPGVNIPGERGMSIFRARRMWLNDLRFDSLTDDSLRLADCLHGSGTGIDFVALLDIGGSTPYSIGLADSSAHWLWDRITLVGGRHLITSLIGDPVTRTGPSHVVLTHFAAMGSPHACIDTHNGARAWSIAHGIVHCTASHGAQIRGTDCSLRDFEVHGATIAVNLPFGADRTRLSDIRTFGCDNSVFVTSSDNVTIDGLEVYGSLDDVIVVDQDNDFPPMSGLSVRNVQVHGDPGGAVLSFVGGVYDPDTFDIDDRSIRALDATTYQTGRDFLIASAATITIPRGGNGTWVLTGTTEVTAIDMSNLREGEQFRLMGQTVGLVVNDGGGIKLASDWTYAANASLTLVKQGTLAIEVGRAFPG